MSFEQSKATKRRYNIGNFHSKYFVGKGIDVGAGNDSLEQYKKCFLGIKSITGWDLKDGDAQKLESLKSNKYNFLVSSHCLEHLVDPQEALRHWARVIKSGGHIIFTVPDEDMYEQGVFPSRFSEHEWTFTIYKEKSWCEKSVNIFKLLALVSDVLEPIKVEKIEDFYDFDEKDEDQTLKTNTEACIEVILRKK